MSEPKRATLAAFTESWQRETGQTLDATTAEVLYDRYCEAQSHADDPMTPDAPPAT